MLTDYVVRNVRLLEMSKMMEIYILEGEHTRCCEMSGCN